ncbi:MAG: pantetheine-phosphate adenylyltransferase [Eggerthellaceae bacterium]|nr:pantetheine-phosphate adenylyltransferase [Eggerthellaceae bacterium]
MATALIPGTFDPITNGHLDVITRASKVFDRVIVAVALSTGKNPLFSHDKRIALAKEATDHLGNVEVEGFGGLLVDFAAEKSVDVFVKGLRAVSDFEYEFQHALMNKRLYAQVETLFLPSSSEYMHLSSSVVREIAQFKGDVSSLVPACVEYALKEHFSW